MGDQQAKELHLKKKQFARSICDALVSGQQLSCLMCIAYCYILLVCSLLSIICCWFVFCWIVCFVTIFCFLEFFLTSFYYKMLHFM